MKTSKMMSMLDPTTYQRYYEVEGVPYGVFCDESVKGAIVHFKETNISLFFDFTRDKVSIDGIEPHGTDIAKSKERMEKDYKKIYRYIGPYLKNYPSPDINWETKSYLDHGKQPFISMRMHAELKVKNKERKEPFKADDLFHYSIMRDSSVRGNDTSSGLKYETEGIKDITLLTKSMFHLPKIFHYTVPKET